MVSLNLQHNILIIHFPFILDAVLDICFDVPHGSMSNVTAAHWNIAVESEAGGSVAAGTLSIPGCFRDHLSIDSLGLNSLHFTLTESTNTSVCQLWDPFLSYRTYDREGMTIMFVHLCVTRSMQGMCGASAAKEHCA